MEGENNKEMSHLNDSTTIWMGGKCHNMAIKC